LLRLTKEISLEPQESYVTTCNTCK